MNLTIIEPMTQSEAMRCVAEIKTDISRVSRALLELYERQGWKALGYLTWRDCAMSEFGFKKSHVYRLLALGKIERNISPIGENIQFKETHLRVLAPLAPEEQRQVVQAVIDSVQNESITPAHFQAMVKRVQNIKQGLLFFPDDQRDSIALLCGDNDEKVSILQRLFKSQGSPETNGTFDEIMSTGGFHHGDDMDKWLNFKTATVEDTRKALDSLIKFHVALNYKRDMKTNRVGDEYVPQGYDACQTPPYAIEPLTPYIASHRIIWEPARGEGLLANALEQTGLKVVGSDILTGQNFFEFEADAYSCIVTNPPYSLKFKWLERCYQLGKPFALLLPVETLGAKTAQEMFKHYGAEFLMLNKRVSFKMPNKGWDGAGAQFPTMWVCWKLLPTTIVYGEITRGGDEVHE